MNFVGVNSGFKSEQVSLLFNRHSNLNRFAFTDFCRLVLPNDISVRERVTQRQQVEIPMMLETVEILKRLLRALLSLVQA